jgi:uncharacterized protein YjiS (DUF1127 family)
VEIAMASLPLHLHHRGASMPVDRARKAAPGLLGRVLQTLRLWHRRVTERDALSRLTDRDLRDMRISPYDAGVEVCKPFWRD